MKDRPSFGDRAQLLSTLRGSAHRVDEPEHPGLLVDHLGLHRLLPSVSLG